MSTRQTSSRLEMLQARFQQKQLQEKEQKLLQLYDQQQQRAYQVVQRTSAGSNASNGSTQNQRIASRTSITTYTNSSTQGGKVRQMFDERRQTTKGIDRSYPLEPLDNKLKKDVAMNGHGDLRKKMQTKDENFVSVKTEIRADVNSNMNGGKPVISYHDEITRRTFATPPRGNTDESFRENHHYNNRYEAEVEDVLDTETIERNRMMAKIHLLDFDDSMKHRVKNDLDSVQFPEDLMIDVPDKVTRKNVNRKLSQSEARLERFRNQNTKKSTLSKNPTPALSKKPKEQTLSTKSTSKTQDVSGSKPTDVPVDESKRLINFHVRSTPREKVIRKHYTLPLLPGEKLNDIARPSSFLVKPKVSIRKARAHQESWVGRRTLKPSSISVEGGISGYAFKGKSQPSIKIEAKTSLPDTSEKWHTRPEYFCKESERSATTFSLRPMFQGESVRKDLERMTTPAPSFYRIPTKSITTFTKCNAPKEISDKENEIKECKFRRLRHGYYRETASSILKHKKKKFTNGFTAKKGISMNKKSTRTDARCLKSVEYVADAAECKNKDKRKCENNAMPVKYEGRLSAPRFKVTEKTDLTGTSSSTHRNRVRLESFDANGIEKDSDLRKNVLKGSMKSEGFPKRYRSTNLKRSPSVKQLRSIEDIRKSIHRLFTLRSNFQIEPSSVLTNQVCAENVMTCLERRPRIVGRYSVPMRTLAPTNYKSIKHIRNIEFRKVENNTNKRKSHLFRIVKDPSPDSSAKNALGTTVRTTARKSVPTSPSKSPDNTTRHTSVKGTPVKSAAFCGSERLMSSTKRSTDTVDNTTNGYVVVSSPEFDEYIKSHEAKAEADVVSTSTTERVEPMRRMSDRPSSSASSTISNLKDKMSTKTKSVARTPKTSNVSSKSTTDKSVINTANNLDNLLSCKICGRRFAQDRIELHEKICMKTAQKKRKQFDATMFRVRGTDLEPFVKKGMSKKQTETKTKKPESKSNWRRKHEDFINAIRSAKQVQAHLAAGGKLSDLPPPPPSDTSDYIQCPHCGRKFNKAAAERHIPKCQHMMHNKTPNTRTSLRSKR